MESGSENHWGTIEAKSMSTTTGTGGAGTFTTALLLSRPLLLLWLPDVGQDRARNHALLRLV